MTKPTMDDVANRAGVSRALVSLVMRNSDKVSDRSRAAVEQAATELGYRPNLSARHLASKRTRTIGMVINDLHNPYFAGVADGVKTAADERGYRLLLSSAFLNVTDERQALETFIDFNVDGIILSGARVSQDAIEDIAKAVPVVVTSDPTSSTLIDSIHNDDHLGATMVVDHLVGLGHEQIVHIDGGRGAGAKERRSGYRAAMRRHGLAPRVVPGRFTEASGVTSATKLLASDEPFTAIFAGNDMCALGALTVLNTAGVQVPDEVSVVGYDNTFVSALGRISLTSVDQHRDQIGRRAVAMLLERLDDGRTHSVHDTTEPSLINRSTTAAVR